MSMMTLDFDNHNFESTAAFLIYLSREPNIKYQTFYINVSKKCLQIVLNFISCASTIYFRNKAKILCRIFLQ